MNNGRILLSIFLILCVTVRSKVLSTVMSDMEVFWTEPPNSNPQGIVVLFHGCQHSGGDFFVCEGCLGLPEEVTISQFAVSEGLVVVAITSSDRFTGCWSQNDIESTISIIHEFKRRLHVTTVFGIGASSGGAFLSKLATKTFFTAISVQIMGCSSNVFNAVSFPPIEFVTMSRDIHTDARVSKNIELCKSRNIAYQKRACLPIALNKDYFHYRTLGQIDIDLSKKIYNALMDMKFIDRDSGLLLMDPRESEWRMALERFDPEIIEIYDLPMAPDESAISEALNVAWAMHEICASDIEQTFLFFKTSILNRGITFSSGS
jgi:hypothetical protein